MQKMARAPVGAVPRMTTKAVRSAVKRGSPRPRRGSRDGLMDEQPPPRGTGSAAEWACAGERHRLHGKRGSAGGAVGAAAALPEIWAWVEWGWVQWRPVRHALDMRSRASKRRSVTWVWDALPNLGLELGS